MVWPMYISNANAHAQRKNKSYPTCYSEKIKFNTFPWNFFGEYSDTLPITVGSEGLGGCCDRSRKKSRPIDSKI